MKKALSIAGLDPSAGAGLLADVRTFEALGLYPLGVASSLTVQNSKGVSRVEAVDDKLIKSQISSLLEDIKIDVIKIGLISDMKVADVLYELLRDFQGDVILDTPLVSSSGFLMVDEKTKDALIKLFEISTLITPNLKEAEVFLGFEILSLEDMKRAAFELKKLESDAVLITGGDKKESALDVLYDGEFCLFEKPKIDSSNTHGTGCVYSSAIASFLANGVTLQESVEKAKEFVYKAIKNGYKVGEGEGVLDIRRDYAR